MSVIYSLIKKRQRSGFITLPMVVFSGESNSGGQALNADADSGEIGERTSKILNNNTLEFEPLNIGVNQVIGHVNNEGGNIPTTMHSWELGLSNLKDSGVINSLYIVKTGQGGTTIAKWAEGEVFGGIVPWTKFQDRVDAALLFFNPTGTKFALFYSHGINDILNAVSVSTWKAATLAHFAKIRVKYGTVPIVMTKIMSTAGAAYTSYNTAIDEICSEIERCYNVEVSDLTQDDVYHWDYAGQKTLAERMYNKLRENGFEL